MLAQQVQSASLLDRTCDFPMKLGGYARGPPWKDLATLSCELREDLRVVVIYFFQRDIESTARHATVRSTKVGHSLSSLWLHLSAGSLEIDRSAQ